MATEPNCIFCRIGAGEFGTAFLYESDKILAFADLAPQAATHVLIIPRRHIPGIAAITAADGDLLVEIIQVANQLAISQGISETGYRVLTNNGDHAGQTVHHLHLHLMGGNELGPLG